MKEPWRSGSNELWGECLVANTNEDTASVDSDGEHLLSVAPQHPKDLHEYQQLFPASYRGLLRATASCNLHRPSPSPHNWKAPWLPVCLFIYQGSGNCTPGKFRNCILFYFYVLVCMCVCTTARWCTCGYQRAAFWVCSFFSSIFICALGIKLKVPCASSASAHWAILPALVVTVWWQTWEENKKELLGLCPVNLFSLEFLRGHVFLSPCCFFDFCAFYNSVDFFSFSPHFYTGRVGFAL